MKIRILPKQHEIFLPILAGAVLFTNIVLRAQVASQQPQNESWNGFPAVNKYSGANLSYKIIDASNNTYGYDIYDHGRMLIHQASIPALTGNEGFKTKSTAGKVARFVITKINKGEMPPTVTVNEMKKLHAIN